MKLTPKQVHMILRCMDIAFYTVLVCTIVAGFYFFITLRV